jgi:Concanavalin A-like lectin/glucanases superfamily
MFRKIVHYTFKKPHAAFDISPFHQHGQVTSVGHSTDGSQSGSGAMLFNGNRSRVRVPFGTVWQELGAIRIEALVRIDELGKRHNLVEGLLSFALFVRSDGVVTGTFLGLEDTGGPPFVASNSISATVLGGGGSPDPFSTLTATPPDPDEPEIELTWIGVNSDSEFAPDGIRRTVTPGEWTRIVFVHDGISLQLWLDGVLAGYRDDNITSGVLGVHPGGVHIGAWPNADNYVLKGALDEISIWKFDPYFQAKQFFCRPLDTNQAVCWRGLLEHIQRQWRDPDSRPRVEKALDCILDAVDDLLRSIQGQGAEAIQQAQRFRHHYDRLWCEGKIDGPEMADLLKDFGEWIERTAGTVLGEAIAKLIGCRHDLKALGSGYDLRCVDEHDPDWRAYAKLIGKHTLQGFCSPFGPAPDEPRAPYQSNGRH